MDIDPHKPLSPGDWIAGPFWDGPVQLIQTEKQANGTLISVFHPQQGRQPPCVLNTADWGKIQRVTVGSGEQEEERGGIGAQTNIGGDVHGPVFSGDFHGPVIYNAGYRPGSPFQAPPLPAHFVERPEISEPLLAKVLAEDPERRALVVSALHGLGGIGKSTLAQYLVTRREVRERFPDGILWATLGQQPDLLSLLHSWLHALGLYDPKALPPSVEAAAGALRTFLVDKACLLVVDDAWQAEHALPFLGGGPRCRALITTREAVIARATNADLFNVGVLLEGQALTLLANKLGRALGADEIEPAKYFAQAVGYLPLALELAAAQVAAGISWQELLADFNAETARLEALDDPDLDDLRAEALRKARSLRASLVLSLRRLAVDELQAFAWLGLLAEDAPFGVGPAGVLWGLESSETAKRLRRLAGKSLLLTVQIEEGHPAYRLHDLLGDLARQLLTTPPTRDFPGLGLALPQAHAALLERYWTRRQNGQWHTFPDDGYIHQHLAWHMEKAGRLDLLQGLLREETADGQNGWYTTCDRLGRPGRFIADVQACWRLSEPDVGQTVRCSLILASLNTLSGNLPTELFAALVKGNLWSPAQGLAYALRKRYEGERSEALAALAPHLPPTQLAEALAAARQFEREHTRFQVLVALVPHMTVKQQPAILIEALATAQQINEKGDRAQALIDLASHLPPEQQPTVLAKALNVAQQIDDDPFSSCSRSQALAALVPHLPLEQQSAVLAEVRAAARQIKDAPFVSGSHSQAPVVLAHHLESEQQPIMLIDALANARQIENKNRRSRTLVALATQLPPEQQASVLDEALDAARQIEDTYISSRALAAIATLPTHLPHPLITEALASTRQIEWEDDRSRAIAILAHHLPPDQQVTVLAEALAVAQQIKWKDDRTQALAYLAPHLSYEQQSSVLTEVLDAIQQTKWATTRSQTLAALAPHLSPSLLAKALTVARQIDDEYNLAQALTELAPYLLKEQQLIVLGEALVSARQIDDEYLRCQALVALAPHLPPEQQRDVLEEALAAARQTEDDPFASRSRPQALAALVPHLPKDQQFTVLTEALVAARQIDDEYLRSHVLAALAPHVPPEQQSTLLAEALAIARYVEDSHINFRFRSQALAILAAPLASQPIEVLLPLWQETLPVLSLRSRSDLLSDISDLAPVLYSIGGDTAMGEIFRAIQDVGRWWP